MRNIEQFIVLFERINKAENDIVLSVNIYKSFYLINLYLY
jgi:hypothetical protein